MNMLFEVQDLAVASPATVSRCGMVYMTPEDLGWRPYVRSWMPRKFPDDSILNDELKSMILDHFELCTDNAIQRIRGGLHEPIPTVDVQLVTSVCNFIEALVNHHNGWRDKFKPDEKKKFLMSCFAFAFAWGMGGSLEFFGKERIDDIVKDGVKSVSIPAKDTIYEYYFDSKKDCVFKNWNTKVPPFVYEKELPYFALMVPTMDTYRYAYCLEHLLLHQKSIFITGQTGVGKSVVIMNKLDEMKDKADVVTININFSAQTNSLRTQQSIEDKLAKKRRTLFGADPGKKIAIFVDDVNMPKVE